MPSLTFYLKGEVSDQNNLVEYVGSLNRPEGIGGSIEIIIPSTSENASYPVILRTTEDHFNETAFLIRLIQKNLSLTLDLISSNDLNDFSQMIAVNELIQQYWSDQDISTSLESAAPMYATAAKGG